MAQTAGPTDEVLRGRRALVTGAGRGLGAAIAERLAEAGLSVVLAARTRSEIEERTASLRARGFDATAIPVDVTDEESIAALLAGAGTIDVLVNNAGDAVAAAFPKITLDEWNRILAVNVTGAFLLTRGVAPGMGDRGWGRIVNVASVAGLHGARFVAHYTAAKHALVGLTRAVAAEYAGRGLGVHAVCPGYLDTPLTERNVARGSERTGRAPHEQLAAMLATTGQRRLIPPVEVVDVVMRLCAGNSNGEIVPILGGDDADLPFEVVNPPALGEPRGWSNGIVAPPGARVLFVAGQAGWSKGLPGTPPGFAGQFARALDQVLEVVRGAGGSPRDVARLTVYVSDLEGYLAARRELGPLWRERFGTYYPAMALVQVRGLVDPGAVLEIEATAALGGAR